MRPRRALPLLAPALALLLLSCLGGGNSGSETTNGLAGRVRDSQGSPVAGARVLLLAEDFDPGASGAPAPASPAAIQASGASVLELREAVTDARGAYVFEDVAPGRYHLEMSHDGRGGLALIRDLEMSAGRGRVAADGVLGRPGSLSARVSDFLGEGETGYLYIPGTTALLRLDSSARARGAVTLQRIAAGVFPRLLLVIDAAPDRKIIALAQDFEIREDALTALPPYQTWAHSRKIPINTAAAGVAGMVRDFPLLIRLDSGNFDFAAAQPNGRDLRFAKADGSPIPFQIDGWDAQARRAEIWARVDTVLGNDSVQHVLMHWGRGLTAAEPPGPSVFAPTAGFATVFHLGEAANELPGGYRDATPNGNHATAAGMNADARVAGVVGAAKAFAGMPKETAGTLTAAVPPGLGGNAGFTVSFWMNFRPLATRQSILDYGSFALLKDVHWLIREDTSAQFGPFDVNYSSGSDPATWQNAFGLSAFGGQWIHVATVYDAAAKTIVTYVNGARMDEAPVPSMQIDAAGGLRIGKALAPQADDYPFNGALDELRFGNVPFPADRIKLDYETQKP